jgi:hypothetical protein
MAIIKGEKTNDDSDASFLDDKEVFIYVWRIHRVTPRSLLVIFWFKGLTVPLIRD